MELMKNGLAEPAIKRISNAFRQLSEDFNQQSFEQMALEKLSTLELKQRVNHIIEALQQHLSNEFLENINLFNQIETVWDHGDKDDPYRGFAAWPIIDFISVYGIEHPKESLNTLARLTSLFSAEFAIRPFIKEYPQLCQQQFAQ